MAIAMRSLLMVNHSADGSRTHRNRRRRSRINTRSAAPWAVDGSERRAGATVVGGRSSARRSGAESEGRILVAQQQQVSLDAHMPGEEPEREAVRRVGVAAG